MPEPPVTADEMLRPIAPEGPFARIDRWRDHAMRSPGRTALAALSIYLCYTAFCLGFEAMARARFGVVPEQTVATHTERIERLRAELARDNALRSMKSWGPYRAYDTGHTALSLFAGGVGLVWGAPRIWRRTRKSRIVDLDWVAFKVVLAATLPVILVALPPALAAFLLERFGT